MYVIDEEKERKQIVKKYRQLISVFQKEISQEEKRMIRKAFTISLKAHTGMRRHSGEPYIFHPLEVARIAAQEVGMGPIAVVCALLHDVVEDTEYTLEDIRTIFGDTVATIIDGLTKIDEIMENSPIESLQAENYKKLVMAMADDVRVILLKLCDRLHNMRTLDAMSRDKQLAISSETMFLYVPLAYRLGLYLIKSELEELSMKYTHPQEYNDIKNKLEQTQVDREAYVKEFIEPISIELAQKGYDFNITGRIKSIPSIWGKMKDKNIDFEEVYDVFAVRIILNVPLETEKEDCFKVYSLVSRLYRPNPERFRDWVSMPKTNGYEAIHTTVMGNKGKWVEVQIRSKRMDEIAEKGLAAHYRYKERNIETVEMPGFDNWIEQVRDIIENASNSALKFVDDFKLNLYSDQVTVFTPKGDMKTLPKGACVIDFAFSVHTELGMRCMGAKVNYQVVANNYILKNGDQVQIITSKKTEPAEEWLAWVKTLSAKESIINFIREKRKSFKDAGREKMLGYFRALHIDPSKSNILQLKTFLKINSDTDLYYYFATDQIDLEKVRVCFNKVEKPSPWMIFLKGFIPIPHKKSSTKTLRDNLTNQVDADLNSIFWDEKDEKLKYQIAPCCRPVPGDDVVGLVSDNAIIVHRSNCDTAIEEMSKFKKRIVKAKWPKDEVLTFLTGIKISGIDRKGLLQDMLRVITSESNLNIRGLTMEASQGVVNGILMIYVVNTKKLNELMLKLRKIDGVESIDRV